MTSFGMDTVLMAQQLADHLRDSGWVVERLGGMLKTEKDGHKFRINVVHIRKGK